MIFQASPLQPLSGNEQDLKWMRQALALAHFAKQQNEVPVGAVLVKDGEIIGEGFNRPIGLADPTAHAEIQAIRAASQNQQNYRLNGTTLYVTLEPCAMCAGAIVQARIQRVVFGAKDLKSGACGSVFNLLPSTLMNHRPIVESDMLANECGQILTNFFRVKRQIKEDISC